MNNVDILSKVKVPFTKHPALGEDGKYHIMYKTVCKLTGLIYVGVFAVSEHEFRLKKGKFKNYLGNGINGNHIGNKTSYCDHVKKNGVGSIVREDLIYFKNRHVALAAEKDVVDEGWVNSDTNLNSCQGGGNPPTRSGSNNPNFGNYWNEDQKKASSDRMKGRYIGSKNPNSLSIVCMDSFDFSMVEYSSCNDFASEKGVNVETVRTFIRKGPKVSFKRYLIIKKEDFSNKSEMIDLMNSVIKKSRFKKQIYANRKKH